jgi:hypothetical protein
MPPPQDPHEKFLLLAAEMAERCFAQAAKMRAVAGDQEKARRVAAEIAIGCFESSAKMMAVSDHVLTPERRAEIKRLQNRVAEIRVRQAAERRTRRDTPAPQRTARRREHRSTSRVSRRVATATSGTSSGDSDLPHSPAALEALIRAADELERIERDWNPLPAAKCHCDRPIPEHRGCFKCGHRMAVAA